MSTAPAAGSPDTATTGGVPLPADAAEGQDHATPRPPENRGNLTVADRVVEKIAATAAAQVAHVHSGPHRLTDRLPGRRADRPTVSATVDGHLAQLRIILSVEYPIPVRPVTRSVRGQVRATVERLCDLEVRGIDVQVSALRRDRPDRRRVQ